MITPTPLKPLNPTLHAAYVRALDWHPDAPGAQDPLPAFVRGTVKQLVARRNEAAEADLDRIDRDLVAVMHYYVLRPDEIARDVLRLHGWRSPLTIDQATVMIAAIGEAGYPVACNGAPEHERAQWDDPDPVRGPERDRVIWAASRYWAEMASRHLTYVSLGDSRGYCGRAVQYDQPGSVHPQQKASLTLGPLADRSDQCDSHGYMRRHTRRLVLVRGGAS